MLNAIIIDDEVRSLENLSLLLSKYCPEVTILCTADNINDAYTEIEKHKPELIFLDIDIPPDTGFDLLKKYDTIPFEVIFVTAYDFYAIDAIKFSALYYILKPIKADELKSAIEKAKKKLSTNNSTTTNFFKQLDISNSKPSRIIINTIKETELIELKNIYYLEAESLYTTFYLKDGKKITCSQKNLKDYEELLSDKGFFRTHRSYLVNVNEVDYVDKSEGNEVILKNKMSIPLARRRKEEFLKLF